MFKSNEQGNELPSTGRRASWGAWDQELSEPEGMVYKVQSIHQLRRRLLIVASPTSGHSAFARILLVTRGSHFTFLSFWVPSSHLYIEGFIQMLCRVPASSSALWPSDLNPFWVSDPKDLSSCQLIAVVAEGRICSEEPGSAAYSS